MCNRKSDREPPTNSHFSRTEPIFSIISRRKPSLIFFYLIALEKSPFIARNHMFANVK